MDRAKEIEKCVIEINEICKKYNVSLSIYEHIDYNYDEEPYSSGTSLVLEDEIDGQLIYWDYYDDLHGIGK